MSFNFNMTAQPRSNSKYVEAWHVYDNVEFDGITGPVTGTSKSGNTWKRWEMTFKSPEGIYKESIFEPNEKAAERTEIDGQNGGKIELPSQIETFNCMIQQVVSTYMNDSNLEKFQKLAKEGKLSNIDFDSFIKIISALLKNPKKPSAENPIQLKLHGRNVDGKMYARLPNARISTQKDSAGEVWMTPFLGRNLTLTDYERQQAKATTASKPTDMSSVDKPKEDDIDSLVSDLENSL